MNKSNHLTVERESLQEINRYCALVRRKTGVIKRRIITSLLLEAIRQDVANVLSKKTNQNEVTEQAPQAE